MGRTEEFGAEGRGQTFTYKAEKLIIVDDPKSPLYDPRIHQPVPDWMVKSILELGVLKPILVRRNGTNEDGTPRIEVVDGRQRVRAVREANWYILQEGGSEEDLKLVPAVYKRLDAKAAETVSNAANLSIVDSPLTRAKKIQRYLDNGHTEEAAMTTFGFDSPAALQGALAILECSEEVQKGVEDGTVTLSAAKELRKLPEAKQTETVKKIKSEQKGERKTIRASDVSQSPKLRRAPRIEQLRECAAKGARSRDRIIAEALSWVLGDDAALSDYVVAMSEMQKKKRRKGKK